MEKTKLSTSAQGAPEQGAHHAGASRVTWEQGPAAELRETTTGCPELEGTHQDYRV